jgi:hypothetical protein
MLTFLQIIHHAFQSSPISANNGSSISTTIRSTAQVDILEPDVLQSANAHEFQKNPENDTLIVVIPFSEATRIHE